MWYTELEKANSYPKLRVCEELYYHSKYNPRYIQELGKALREKGIWSGDERKPIKLKLKKEFKETELYQNGLIFVNDRRKKQRSSITSLPASCLDKAYLVSLPTGYVHTSIVFEQNEKEKNNMPNVRKRYTLLDMGEAAIYKAMRGMPIFEFRNLKSFLPNVTSIKQFINDNNYLGAIKVVIRGLQNDIENLSPDNKLHVCRKVLQEIGPEISSINIEYEGTEIFAPKAINKLF